MASESEMKKPQESVAETVDLAYERAKLRRLVGLLDIMSSACSALEESGIKGKVGFVLHWPNEYKEVFESSAYAEGIRAKFEVGFDDGLAITDVRITPTDDAKDSVVRMQEAASKALIKSKRVEEALQKAHVRFSSIDEDPETKAIIDGIIAQHKAAEKAK
jgi:hypothetical protein